MTAALATISKHRNTFLIDVSLLAALYLLPSFSHVTALPLYMFEPMRVALIPGTQFERRHPPPLAEGGDSLPNAGAQKQRGTPNPPASA